MEATSESSARKHEILQFPWTGNREIATTVHEVTAKFTSEELAARYKVIKDEMETEYRRLKMRCELDELRVSLSRWKSLFTPTKLDSFSFIVVEYPKYGLVNLFKNEKEEAEELLLGGVCEQPRPALPKAPRRRDPPPRLSRRSSQKSQPTYLRHRFLPQSRKQNSSGRQR